MDSDRRRFTRENVSLPAYVFDEAAGNTARFSATVMDVSPYGLCLSSPYFAGQADADESSGEFEAVFFAPGMTRPVVLRCKSAWKHDNGESTEIGAFFEGGDLLSLLNLQDYILETFAERRV